MYKLVRRLTKHGAVFGIGAASNSLAGFILIPFYLRQLTANEYGSYALYETFLLAALVFFGMGLNVVLLSRWHRLSPGQRSDLVGGLLTYFSIVGFSSVLLAVAAAQFTSIALTWPLVFTIVGILFLELIWLLVSTIYRAEAQISQFVVASSIRVIGGIVFTVFLISFWNVREEGIFYGRLIGDVAALTCTYPTTKGFRPARIGQETTDLIRLGAPLVPVTFAVTLMTIIPRYVVEWIGNTEEVGTFVMSSKIAGLVTLFFVQPFSLSWMPQLFSIKDRPNAKALYANTAVIYVVVACAIGCIGVLFVSPIASMLASTSFPLSVPVIMIGMLGLLVVGSMHVINIGPYVQERTTLVLPVFLLALLVTLVMTIVLTERYGIQGTAVGILIGQITQVFGLYILNQRIYRIPFPIVHMALIIAISVISVFILYRLEVWLQLRFFAATTMLGVVLMLGLTLGRRMLVSMKDADVE